MDGGRAAGESHGPAQYRSVGEDGQRTMMIASVRYLGELLEQDGQWFFAEGGLMVDWTGTRPSAA